MSYAVKTLTHSDKDASFGGRDDNVVRIINFTRIIHNWISRYSNYKSTNECEQFTCDFFKSNKLYEIPCKFQLRPSMRLFVSIINAIIITMDIIGR